MKNNILACLAALLLLSCSMQAQNLPDSFPKQWKEIDSLLWAKSLPKSAQVKVNALYQKAYAQKNEAQVIKTLLYNLYINDQVTEHNANKQVATIRQEIKKAFSLPQKSILQVLLAATYQNIYYNDRWNISKRTETTNNSTTDINQWTSKQFSRVIDSLYKTALSPNAILQKTKLSPYDAIIIKGNVRYLQPVLYDLLVRRAMDYYTDVLNNSSSPDFTINKEALLPLESFTQYRFTTTDTNAHQWRTISLYQQLLQFHLKDTNPSALIDIDLQRIAWVYQNATFDHEDSLYLQALKNITYRYGNEPIAAKAFYLIAAFYSNRAGGYRPFTDTTYRYDNIIAKDIIDRQLARQLPETEGKSNMQQLLQQITNATLTSQAEKINVPGQDFRLYVSYKNVPVLHGKIIRFSALNDSLNNLDLNNETVRNSLAQQPAYRQFIQPLPVTNDYQQHSTEIKIDALPAGRYMLITGTSSNLLSEASAPLSLQFFDVSAISFLQQGNQYFVLNRETGLPIAAARVTITGLTWDAKSSTYKKDKLTTLTTDQNGRFTRNRNSNDQQRMVFYTQQDTLQAENDYYYYERSSDKTGNAEKRNLQVHFFTDRSIYRPGQVVYFKGIAITSNEQGRKPAIYPSKKPVKVLLYNANGSLSDSLSLTTNEYGSITGRFTLPQQLLTGSFSIRAVTRENGGNTSKGETSFQVEEYKRPSFYIRFDSLQTTYRLNDTIVLTGHAQAYAGNAITNATVTFNVLRNTRFPYAWIFYKTSQPYNTPATIITGTATTNAQGSFTIKFPATPDPAIEVATLPVFTFTATAAVTDISGETRESNTAISAGYRSLLVQLSVPQRVETHLFTAIQASVQNLAGKNIPSKVQVAIYPLSSPERLVRERLWNAPDQFVMSYQEYISHFPHDEYGAESNYQQWPRKKAIAAGSFNTGMAADKTGYSLPSLLPQGWYAIEASLIDNNGDTLKDISYVEVFDRDAGSLPAPAYNWSYAGKTTLLPGDTARLLSGSAADNIFVIQSISRGSERKSDYSYYTLNKDKKETPLVITPDDKGGIYLSYAFVKHNRWYNTSQSLEVPYPDKELQVVYTTYRNKTQPGSQEKWSIQISGEKGTNTAAELLTSMYDASLDQFSPHSWTKPALWPASFASGGWSGGMNFTTARSRSLYFPVKPTWNYTASYDQLLDHVMGYFNGDGISTIRRKTFAAGSVSRMQEGELYLKSSVADRSLPAPAIEGNIALRGVSSLDGGNQPLYVIDGVIATALYVTPDQVASIDVLKGPQATALYGSQGANGVIIVTTKAGKEKLDQPVQIRKNFNETAFFFPQLYADTTGNYTFSFTMPESLTQWKWLSLAHTKDLAFGTAQQLITTQKTVMARVNAPRFVRQGDQLELVVTISNLDTNSLTGTVQLELLDALTNEPVSKLFGNTNNSQRFFVKTGQSTPVSFPVQIPASYNNPLTSRVVAQAGNYSDGEENTFPVLPNRTLVTETLPFLLKGNTTKQFTLNKLAHAQSSTLTHESVTVEYTTNPIWQAIQALPYLAEYPYECAEQTFNRFYANALAAYIVRQHPQIKAVFEQWKKDTTVLQSNLQQNEALKQILLQETPWVLQAANEAQQQKNIALLFDVVKMSSNTETALQQLQQLQLPDGSFSWFKGGNADRYITSYIVTGIGKLTALNAVPAASNSVLQSIAENAVTYLDDRLNDDYKKWVADKVSLTQNNLSTTGIQYLFARSYFKSIPLSDKTASQYLLQQAKQYWMKQNTYNKALLGVVLYRNNQQQVAIANILPSILENAVEDSTKGMYWKDRTTCFWHPSPIEHQATIMLLAAELAQTNTSKQSGNAFNDMRTWLILNKQTNNWGTTVATADACNVLLAQPGSLQSDRQVTIQLGNTVISSGNQTTQAGSGYFKQRIDGSQVTPATGIITVTTSSSTDKSASVSYGAVYWQYFEDMDKITVSADNPLSLTKKWFIEKQTAKGPVLDAITTATPLKVGDKVVIQVVLKSDRDMDYVHVKDMRAASMEPANVLSGYKWQDGLGYYEATKDASTNFFIDHLRKGTYVFNYPVYLTHTGIFTAGIATAQCMYAPAFNSHSEGIRITVGEKK